MKTLITDFIIKTSVFIIALTLTSGCNKSQQGDMLPLLSMMMSNRLTVILKGTYATDRPLEFTEINDNKLFVNANVYPADITDLPTYDQLRFFLDIGEIRLSSKPAPLYTVRTADDAADFWDIVSTTRQVYCSHPYALNPEYDSCWETGGLINYINFMNGEGAIYPSADPGAAAYLHAGVFMRGVVTGFNKIDGLPEPTTFDNNDIYYGENVMPRLNYDPAVTEAEKAYLTPQFFPLHYEADTGQHGTMNLDSQNYYAVLEIRSNLKENIMAHSFVNNAGKQQTVVAFSDWNKAHVNESNIGGNVMTRGRIFYPDITRDVIVEGGTQSNRHYYALYFSHECFDGTNTSCNKEIKLPLAAVPVRSGSDNRIKNIMPGEYFLQCRYDEIYDGWPEKLLSQIKITVETGPGILNIACACGGSTTAGCQ